MTPSLISTLLLHPHLSFMRVKSTSKESRYWTVRCEQTACNFSSSGRNMAAKKTPGRMEVMSKLLNLLLTSIVYIQVPLIAFTPLQYPPFTTSSQFHQLACHWVATWGGDVRGIHPCPFRSLPVPTNSETVPCSFTYPLALLLVAYIIQGLGMQSGMPVVVASG